MPKNIPSNKKQRIAYTLIYSNLLILYIMATLVKFRIEPVTGNVMAYFPQLVHSFNGYRKTHTCYAHIGQHSACNKDYEQRCRPATESEYNDLKQELESIGYALKVCK